MSIQEQAIRRPYVDYYGKHDISPFPDIVDINMKRHFQQRESLYRYLGIVPSFLEGKNIIEFGPGNGVNSLYTMSLKPANYVLVDANQKGVDNCNANFEKFYPLANNYEVINSLVEELKAEKLYDLAICEAIIPDQVNPSAFSRLLGNHVKPGGLYIITCNDVVSGISELLRCLVSILIVDEGMTFSEQVDSLTSVFGSHLSTLKAMTRSHKDWVIDNIFNVEHWRDSLLFSIAEAIEALGDQFSFHGASPCFSSSWRWYKDIDTTEDQFNSQAHLNYLRNVHNFIDYRTTCPERSVLENKLLMEKCENIKQAIAGFSRIRSSENFSTVQMEIESLLPMIKDFSPLTANSLEDFLDKITGNFPASKTLKFNAFEGWWGRGMQYASFIRK